MLWELKKDDFFCGSFYLVFLSCLCLAALWSSAGKGLTSWLSCMGCFLVYLSLSHTVCLLTCEITDIRLLPYFTYIWSNGKTNILRIKSVSYLDLSYPILPIGSGKRLDYFSIRLLHMESRMSPKIRKA